MINPNKSLFIYIICHIFLLPVNLYAQECFQKYNFTDIKEGISKVGVYTILQDDIGFIWLGTNGAGLYRYDGISYVSYKSDINDTTSISSNLVLCSYLDSKNRLWFGTAGGLNLYDRKNNRFKRVMFSSLGKRNEQNISVRCLQEDKDGNLFIGTLNHGLYKLSGDNLKIEKILCKETIESTPININAIQINKSGKIYTATSRGMKEFDKKTNSLVPSLFNNNELSTNSIEALLIDKQQTIWAATLSSGLYKINEVNTGVFKIKSFDFSKNKLFSLISLKDGTIMCSAENDGLFHLNRNGDIICNYKSNKGDKKGIRSNSIWSLYLDKNQRIWLGYYNAGVSVYDELYDKFEEIESLYYNPNSLQDDSVTAIVQDQLNRLWISMDGGGIDILDTSTNKFTHINKTSKSVYSGLSSNYIVSMFIDSKQNLWAGSWDKGVFFLKKGTNNFINYNIQNTNGSLASNSIMTIAEDAKGVIWLGTFRNGGLHSYNPKTNKFIHHNSEPFLYHGLVNSEIRKIVIDNDDNMWLGTTAGLFKVIKLDNDNFSITSISDKIPEKIKNNLNSSHILSLHKSNDNSLWIGTRGAGLYKYDTNFKTFKWYNNTNGLEQENINGIVSSLDGNIWLSGNSGITKLDVVKDSFTNYTINDGLLSNDYNINSGFIDNNQTIYFGNFQGIDYFNPSKISINKGLTSLYLNDFKLFNESIKPNHKDSPLEKVISETKSITLNSKQSVFTIEYLGLNFTRPEEINYAYYLKGYEDTWNYVGKKRNATYTNLDQGEYVFKLKASNNDGVWNESPLTLNITILPPWWKTNWAFLSYIILVLFGVYLLNKVTKARIKEKQHIANERTKRLQEIDLHKKKFQFFTNISHEFRTPLTLIINPLKDIINNPQLSPEKIKYKHKVIYKNADRLSRLINELLDFRKLELNKVRIKARELNLVDFSKDIMMYFNEEAFTRNIALSLDTDTPNIFIWVDESMLEKTIFNLLSNAFKATPDNGTITVQLIMNDDLYRMPLVDKVNPIKVAQIIISDSGPGIKKKEVKKIFERFYQVENLSKTYFGGTGIGLEVVKNFIELHKGKIKVKSKNNSGTTFIIRLPQGTKHFNKNEIMSDYVETLIQKENNTINSEIEITEQNKPQKYLISHTLLIVEDNIELRNYLKEELKNQFKILTAKNGEEALKIAKESLPDVIISDVIMPKMDGFVFCKKIKEDIRTSHIPILMLTAKARIENRMEGIKIGADAYMIKPFDIRLLRLRLSQLTKSRQIIFNKYFSVISDVPAGTNTSSLDKEFINKILNYIKDNIGDPNLNVEELASQLNLSRSHFYRKVKALTNQTANEFLRNIRLQKAKQILQTGNYNINEVCYKVGFSTPSYFSKCYKNYFGILPTQEKVNKH